MQTFSMPSEKVIVEALTWSLLHVPQKEAGNKWRKQPHDAQSHGASSKPMHIPLYSEVPLKSLLLTPTK